MNAPIAGGGPVLGAPIAAATVVAPAVGGTSNASAIDAAGGQAVPTVVTFLALLATLTSRPASPSPEQGKSAVDPSEIPASPTPDDASTTDVPTAPPSLAALLLALAATPPTLAVQAPAAPPATGATAEPGSTAPAIAQAGTKRVPGNQPASGGSPAGSQRLRDGSDPLVRELGADLVASRSIASLSTTTGVAAPPRSITIADAPVPPSTGTAGVTLDTTTTAGASALETTSGAPDVTSTRAPSVPAPLAPLTPSASPPFASIRPDHTPGAASRTPGGASHTSDTASDTSATTSHTLGTASQAPGTVPHAPGLSASTAPFAADTAPTVHSVLTVESVEFVLTPAAMLALSSDAERSTDDPGERRPHDPGAGVEVAGSALGGRVERAHEGVGPTAPMVATAEDVVRQIAPRLAALPRSGRHEIVLRLDPPTLGEVRIEASLRGQELTLHIRAENAGARDLLEQGLPQLRQALERDGVTAGHISVELNLQADARRPSHGTPFARPAPAIVTETPAIAPPRQVSSRAVSSTALDLWV